MASTLFISTTFAPDQSKISEVLELCTKKGIQNVELGSNHCYEPDLINVIGKFVGRCNFLVHNYFPVPEESFVINIASLNDEIQKKSIRHILEAIDFCQKIDAKLYTFHPGFLTDPREAGQDASRQANNYDFCFDDRQLSLENYQDNYHHAFKRMIEAVKSIVKYAKAKKVRIAIETEGSISKKEHVLMQRPEEYQQFFQHFSPEETGINLNLGHLSLASKAFGFERKDFVDLVAPYVVALEMSHNEGINDDHLLLKKGEWYWEIISDFRFKNCYKIIETRNIPLGYILENIGFISYHCGR